MDHKHLSLEERERLFALKSQGKSFRQIAKLLGRTHTTWSREWKRNAPYFQEYLPCRADLKAQRRSSKQRSRSRLKKPLIMLYVKDKLRQYWSPETISGRLPLDYPGEGISPETIYSYIYAPENRRERLERYLTHKRKRRRKRKGRRVAKHSKIKNAQSIDKRHKKIEQRRSAGHWETDLMEGPRESSPALKVNVERKFRCTLLSKVGNKSAEESRKAILRRFSSLPKRLRKTFTADNGSENACHEDVSRHLNIKWYFCHPYHSWERGTVENMIGRIRRFLPKGTDLRSISRSEVEYIEYVLNNTPRKCLDFKTPVEAMKEAGYTPP